MEIAMRMIGKGASDCLHGADINGERRLLSNRRHTGSLLEGVCTRIGSVFRMISRWIDRSNQRNALADLDDHLLRDIGKSSGDALREASKPFWKS